MFRDRNGAKTPQFLWHYVKMFVEKDARDNIIKNIWLFIPLGAISYRVYSNSKILLILILFSIAIEGAQYVTGTGFCELDDIISNSLGGAIGFYVGKLTGDFLQRIKPWKHIHII